MWAAAPGWAPGSAGRAAPAAPAAGPTATTAPAPSPASRAPEDSSPFRTRCLLHPLHASPLCCTEGGRAERCVSTEADGQFCLAGTHQEWQVKGRCDLTNRTFSACGKLKRDAKARILSEVKCLQSFLCELKKTGEDKLAFKLRSHCACVCIK